MSQSGIGRVRQKQRTRDTLLKSARELLAGGHSPTLLEIADHAAVSRATAYRYYANSEVLLQEAVLDGIAQQIGALQLDAGIREADLELRVEGVVSVILDMVLANEALFRTYLKGAVAGEARRTRGARRIRWLHDAYGSDKTRFTPKLAERMTQALALLTGIETVVVAKDVCGLDDAGTRAMVIWTARAILAAAIRESRPAPATASGRN